MTPAAGAAAAISTAGGRETIGAAVAVVSAVLYDAGYVLEKQALSRLPEMRVRPSDLVRTARASRRWLAGFGSMLAGLGLQVVALTLAPVAVVQTILAAGLVALAPAAGWILGERLTRRQRGALGLVLVAVAAAAVSAGGSGDLARTVPSGRFLLLAVAAGAAGAVASRAGLGSGRLRGLTGVAVGAGLLYGLGAVAEKAVATRMVAHGMLPGAVSSLGTIYPWLFVAATLAGMLVFQVGLQAHPASLMAALTNVVSGACALAGAALVFGEALLPAGGWSLLRVGGFAAVVAAVGVLVRDSPAVAVTR